MMAIAGALVGAVWGGVLAKRRNGNSLDILQYATGYGIAFGLVALFLSIAVVRLMQRASKQGESRTPGVRLSLLCGRSAYSLRAKGICLSLGGMIFRSFQKP